MAHKIILMNPRIRLAASVLHDPARIRHNASLTGDLRHPTGALDTLLQPINGPCPWEKRDCCFI
jgi:hypothetical protein